MRPSSHVSCILLGMILHAAAPVGQAHAATAVLVGSAGSGPAPSSAMVERAARTVLGEDEPIVGAAADLLGLADHPIRLTTAPPEACHGDPVSASDLALAVAETVDAVDSLEYAEARNAAERARALLPCAVDPVDTDTLYRLSFAQGLAGFYSEEPETAARCFQAAAAIDPTRPWNDDYAPAPTATFLEALQDVLNNPGVPLEIDAGVGRVQLDGRAVTGRVEGLSAGRHFVQVGDPGSMRGLHVTLPPGLDPVALVTGEGMEHRVMRGDPAVAWLLTEAATEAGWDEVLLVSELGILSFAPATREFKEVPDPRPPNPAGGLGSRQAPPVALGVALLAGGSALAGFGFGGYTAEYLAGEDATTLEDYQKRYDNHIGAFGIGVAGAAAAGIGLGLTLAAGLAEKQTAGRPLVLPYAFAGPAGVSFGFAGRF